MSLHTGFLVGRLDPGGGATVYTLDLARHFRAQAAIGFPCYASAQTRKSRPARKSLKFPCLAMNIGGFSAIGRPGELPVLLARASGEAAWSGRRGDRRRLLVPANPLPALPADAGRLFPSCVGGGPGN